MNFKDFNLKESLKISKDEIDWKSLIFGAAFCAVLAMIGSEPELWFFIPLSAIGLLYIGYEAKNLVWGAILGAIGSLPLFVVTLQGGLGTMVYSPTNIAIILISCLVIGAVTGFVGTYVKIERNEALEMREADAKKNSKKSKKK